MYRMLTGCLVDPRQERVELPSSLNTDLDGEWDAFLLKALDVDPARRFESALQMRVVLEHVYLNWKIVSEKSCSFTSANDQAPEPLNNQVNSEPGRIMYKNIRQQLDLDELFRPVSFFRHQLEVVNPMLLHDPVTRLFWQRSGTGFTLNWQQAKDYVVYLNEVRFQSRDTWRLPTAAELITVLRSPTVQRDFCIDPHFQPSIHWLWSSDHCTKKAAWMVDIVESHIERLDMDGTASVCAVSF